MTLLRFRIDKNRQRLEYGVNGQVVSLAKWKRHSRKHTQTKLRLIREFYQWLGYECIQASSKLEVWQKDGDNGN